MPVLAVIGAESSGKTSLADALGVDLPALVVPEQLRAFVATHGRPPGRNEQAGVMAAQVAAEGRAVVKAGWVISDSGALMTAVYSLLYFGDDSLVGPAIAHHRAAYALTIWCDIDIPWLAEPGVRDGREHRIRAHAIIGRLVHESDLPVLAVAGSLTSRVQCVRAAIGSRR